jgi:hypothetical protein
MGAAVGRGLVFLIAGAMLAACGDASSPSQKLAEAETQCARIYDAADLKPLAGKIAGPGTSASSSLLTDPEKPDTAQRIALGRYAGVIAQCRAMQDLADGAPNTAEQQARNASDELLSRLEAQEISFGEYNRGIALTEAQRNADNEDEAIRQMRRSLTQPVFPPQGPLIYCGRNLPRPYC